LNADLAVAEAWSVGQIDARSTTLVNQALKRFAIIGTVPNV
jgi:hypothetical protein